jgi:hypothetical protein
VLVVYECLKPGALVRVLAFDAEGNELNAWSGKDPSPPDSGNGSAISVVPLKLKKIKIVRLRLVFDSQNVEGWNEIDAAGILDVKGAIHWATAATASSTWVDPSAASTTFLGEPLSEAQSFDSKARMINLRAGAIDPVSAALGGVLSREASTALLKNIQGVSSVADTDPRIAGYELLFADQTRGNATRGGAADHVALFEERIKKLESDLAGLREALKQLKPQPGE